MLPTYKPSPLSSASTGVRDANSIRFHGKNAAKLGGTQDSNGIACQVSSVCVPREAVWVPATVVLARTMETTITFCADLQGIPPGDGSQASLKAIHDSLTKQVLIVLISGQISNHSTLARALSSLHLRTTRARPPYMILNHLMFAGGSSAGGWKDVFSNSRQRRRSSSGQQPSDSRGHAAHQAGISGQPAPSVSLGLGAYHPFTPNVLRCCSCVESMHFAERAPLRSLNTCALFALPSRAAQAEVLTPREVPAFIDVTLAFLEHCNWRQVVVAPKQRE